MNEAVPIESQDFWVKVVDMLQQNWAVIEPTPAVGVRVHFISDTSGVFDEIAFPSTIKASRALHRNGFRGFSDEPDLQSFLRQPSAPFHRSPHPNGPIYSSGRFWQS
jgi:hypothetical protein